MSEKRPEASKAIDASGVRGATTGRVGRPDPSGYDYGPSKRSADVNDYTALEAELARANEENGRLRAAVDGSLKREGALRDELRYLKRILGVDRKKVEAYLAASAAAATSITPRTPMSAIEAALTKRRLAVEIADQVTIAAATEDVNARVARTPLTDVAGAPTNVGASGERGAR